MHPRSIFTSSHEYEFVGVSQKGFNYLWVGFFFLTYAIHPSSRIFCFNCGMTRGAIHSTKIPTGPTGKRGPPQKVDPFFRNFSGWTEPIHWVLDRNFRKFWLNGSRPQFLHVCSWWLWIGDHTSNERDIFNFSPSYKQNSEKHTLKLFSQASSQAI